MQNANNSHKVPYIRFPEFNEEWEIKTGQQLFLNRRISGIEGLPIYSVTIDRGLLPRRLLGTKRIEDDAKTEDNIVAYPNDIVYNTMRMWQGAFGVAKEKCMVSPAYIVLEPNKNVSSDFYYHLLKTNKYNYQLWRYSYGITDDRLRLYYKDFSLIELPQPTLSEQEKISNFLSKINELLDNLNQQIVALERYKKAVAQKIFSRKIRFNDASKDNTDWKEVELGMCLTYEQPSNYIVKTTNYDDSFNIPVLTAGKKFILGYTNETEAVFEKELPVIIFDDFTTTSQYVDFPFKVKSSAMKILKANNGYDTKFIYEAMQLIKFNTGQHGRHWISRYAHMKVMIPSLKEQQQISSFLSDIDLLIKSKKQKISKIELWKAGIVEKMFI